MKTTAHDLIITIEGQQGTGKTSTANRIADMLAGIGTAASVQDEDMFEVFQPRARGPRGGVPKRVLIRTVCR